MKRAVGLLVMFVDSRGELKALLQRRGSYNHQTKKAETWAYSYQPTTHGGIKIGENVDVTVLLREAGEELGADAALQLAISIAKNNPLITIAETHDEQIWMITYGIKMPESFIDNIRLSPSTGGILPIDKIDLQLLMQIEGSGITKTGGVSHNGTIAMFKHNIKAVRQAFEVFNASVNLQ